MIFLVVGLGFVAWVLGAILFMVVVYLAIQNRPAVPRTPAEERQALRRAWQEPDQRRYRVRNTTVTNRTRRFTCSPSPKNR